MDIAEFIEEWISTGNNYDTEKYLEFYHADAVLDDPSVGRKFIGKEGIKNYFESYFIGYKTHTKVVHLIIENDNQANLEVVFTGDFSEGTLGGTFDLTFKEGKIVFLTADLIL
jgi:ketosteroid isomerase-like protein